MNTKNKLFSTKLAIALAALGMLSGSAQAGLIAYDQFTGYTDGSLVGQGQGDGWGTNNWTGSTGANGAANVSSTGNLTYTGLPTAGGGVTSGTNSTADNMFQIRALGSPIAASGTVYFGFLLQRTGNPSKAGVRINGLRTADSKSLYAGGGSWDSTSNWELYTREDNSFPKTSTGIAETTNVTHFVVKMDFTTLNSHTAYLFVDPTTGSSFANVDADASYDFGSNSNWSTITNVQASHSPTSGNTGSMAFDEIRIGTTAADMFTAIPEPSAFALIGLGGMALFLRRRRA